MSVVTNTTAKPAQSAGEKVKGFFKEMLKKPSYTPPTLRKKSFIEKYAYLLYVLLAFLIPFLLMFFAFKVMGVAPYGTKQILVTDLWHQYYPFLVDYQSKLKAGESLLWSWTSGGGTNYIALIAYYLASPLNFFSVMVPADHLREFFFVITCVKIGLAGMFYSLFIRITFNRKDLSITAFGIMYSLCAFIMGYYWNIIWLDSVALLPLVAAGAFALLRKGKFKLYIISLALSILANYYIGLFICIAVVLLSVGYTIVEYKGWKQLIKDFFKMLGCSIVAIMMTAILTVPAYFALGHAYSSANSFPEKFAVNIGSTPDFAGVLEGICKTISNSVAFVQPTAKEGLPNVYTGVITIFLAILFLFCAKIKLRERLVCGFLLLFFLTSFVIRQLDYIWHGFHFPNMLPYRFSFLWSFVLIYMAFRVFMNIDYVKLGSVIAAIAGFLVYLYIASIYFKDANVNISSLFKATEEGQTEIDPIYLSGWIGLILAAWILLYVLREQLPRLVIAIGVAGTGIASLFFFRDLFTKIDPALFKTPVNAEAPQETAPVETKTETFSTVFTIVFVAALVCIIILLLSRFNANNVILKTVMSLVLVLMALFEGIFSATTGVRTVSVTDATSYPLGTTSTAECVDFVNEREKDNTDLARTEFTRYHTLNDDALNGVNGVSMFNSMVNMPITNYMEKFGICGWIASNRYSYMQSSPFTDLMLNIKYLIDPYYGNYADQIHYDKIYVADAPKGGGTPAIVMQNKYYIPMGFMVNEDLLRYDAADSVGFINKVAHTEFSANAIPVTDNPVDNQNTFFRLATGLKQDLYEKLEVNPVKSDASQITKSLDDKFSYSNTNASGSCYFTSLAPHAGTAMAYVEGYGVEDTNLYINDNYVGHFGTKRPLIMMIGSVNQGDTIKVEAKISNNSSGTITCNIIMLDDAMFEKAHSLFSRSVLKADKVSGDTISGTIDVAEDGLFYTSIPYVTGWHAYVDGKEVEIKTVGSAMLTFLLSKGEHKIELKYAPEGFTGGVVISLLGLFIFILMILAVWQKKRLLPVWKKATAKVTAVLPKRKENAPADTAKANPDDEADAQLTADERKEIDESPEEDPDDFKTVLAEEAVSESDEESPEVENSDEADTES